MLQIGNCLLEYSHHVFCLQSHISPKNVYELFAVIYGDIVPQISSNIKTEYNDNFIYYSYKNVRNKVNFSLPFRFLISK